MERPQRLGEMACSAYLILAIGSYILKGRKTRNLHGKEHIFYPFVCSARYGVDRNLHIPSFVLTMIETRRGQVLVAKHIAWKRRERVHSRLPSSSGTGAQAMNICLARIGMLPSPTSDRVDRGSSLTPGKWNDNERKFKE